MELHSAHGYLLNQFFSPLANHRTDDYGPQSVENRIRFHRQVLQAVREAVGADYPIACGWAVTMRPEEAPLPTAWRPAPLPWHKAAWICWTSPAA